MVHGPTHNPITGILESIRSDEDVAREECIKRGGEFVNGECIIPSPPVEPEPEPEPEPERPEIARPEIITNQDTGQATGVILPDGTQFLGIGPQEIQNIIGGQAPVRAGTARRSAEGGQLATQVGQTQQSVFDPTGLNFREGVVTGLREAIPGAVKLAGGAAVAGAIAGGGTPASPLLAAGAAAVAFSGAISASILSNFRSQRTDTTTSQQRVLDEGKQALQDWVGYAREFPFRKQEALSAFNQQLQQIQDAHVQMLTDTNADVLKFETALPNLAEFNSFYSLGGERDVLVGEMRLALASPSNVALESFDLAQRRL